MCNRVRTSNTKEEEGVDDFVTAEEYRLDGESRRDKDIQRAKSWLREQNIPQTGFNRSIKHKYYEFEDFIGYVLKACDMFDLSTHFTVEDLVNTVNRPKTMRNEADNMPTVVGIARLEVKSVHYHEPRVTRVPFAFMVVHQETGKALSYAKRYAFMIAFDISDNDIVDATVGGNNGNGGKSAFQNKTVNNGSNNATSNAQNSDSNSTSNNDTNKDTSKDTDNDDTWKQHPTIKALHNKMRKKNKKAFLDKKTTAKFAEMELVEGNLKQTEYNAVLKEMQINP